MAPLLRRFARAIASLPPAVVLLTAWTLLAIYAFPGQMTQDSYDHLSEARAGLYTDAHPPAIDLLWHAVDTLIAGPFGMFVIQSVALLGGLYAVLRRTFTPRRAAWSAAALFLFPPIMVPMGVIWKDCLMAGFLMLGFAALPCDRKRVRVAGLVALWAATAVRYNAFGATLPLVLVMFEWRPGLAWFKRYPIALAVWLGVTLAAFGFNAAITDRHVHFWQSSLAPYDIAGTLAHLDDDLPDAELQRTFAGTGLVPQDHIHAKARALYTPADFLPLVLGDQAMWRGLPLWGIDPAPEPQRAAMTRAWWDIVSTHPAAYVKHRLSVTAELLWLTGPRPPATITKRDSTRLDLVAQLELNSGWSKLQHRLSRCETWLWKHTPLFVPWVYLILSLILLPLARRHRDLVALLASGLVLESSLVFLAPSTDFRYSHWMIICTSLAVVVLTARRMSRPGGNDVKAKA